MGPALIAAERGYGFTAAVAHYHASRDKLRAMQAFGAELITVFNDDWLRERNLPDPGIERELDALVGQMQAPARHPELQ